MLRIICVTFVFQLFASFASTQTDVLKTNGDILIGGLFPIHNVGANDSICGSFNSNPGYQYMEAMLYALDRINADPRILPGIKLGSVIADTCNSALISRQKTRKFIKIILVPESSNFSQLVSVVGPMTGLNDKDVANILQVFRVPQISYGAMSSDLGNKESYKYFFRTVAPNQLFYAAMASFLGKTGWRYVALVYSKSIWHRFTAERFKVAMKDRGICVFSPLEISQYTSNIHLDKYVEKLVSDDSKPNIVIFVTSTHDSHIMLAAKKRNQRGNKLTFVAGVSWSNRKSITQDFEEVAVGTFSFGQRQGSIPEFEKYFHELRYSNYTRKNKYWIGEYWQETHQCNLPELGIATNFATNCTGKENNAVYKEFSPVQVVINAVYAIASAIDTLQKHLCANTTRLCSKMRLESTQLLLEYIKNTTFKDACLMRQNHSTLNRN